MRIKYSILGGAAFVAACFTSSTLAAQTLPVAPSQVTPRKVAPAPAPQTIERLPAAEAPSAPNDSANLAISLGDVQLDGGFPEMAAANAAFIVQVSHKQQTVGSLFEAARLLEQAYAANGYILARITIPPQTLGPDHTARVVVTVGKAALTITAKDAAKTYDGLSFNGGNGVSYAGLVNNETASVLGGSLVYGGASQGAVNAGAYSLSASGLTSGNYDITYVDGALAISPRQILIVADSLSRHSGQPNPLLTYTIGGLGLVSGDSMNGALGTSATIESVAGSYAIELGTLSASANYEIEYVPGTLTVEPVLAGNGRQPSLFLRQPWTVRSFSDLILVSDLGCDSNYSDVDMSAHGLTLQKPMEFCTVR